MEWTNLGTLYLRAYESRSPGAILRDAAVAEAVVRVEYDWPRMRRVMRPGLGRHAWQTARRLEHRLPSPPTERRRAAPRLRHGNPGVPAASAGNLHWFDLDQANVIALRRKLYDERVGYG